jgi:hypothetical protein
LGVNLGPDNPGVEAFRIYLLKLRDRADVQDVLIEIYDIDVCAHPDAWPFSEAIYVITSAWGFKVQGWAADLRADAAIEGWRATKPANASEPKHGYRVWRIIWD